MKSYHRLVTVAGCIVAVSCGAVVMSVASAASAAEPSGKITVLAPCDAHPPSDEIKALQAKLMSVLKLDKTGVVFASVADVKSDADGTIFVLDLKVEQGGVVVSSGQSKKVVNAGQAATLGTFCGVSPCSGTCRVSASVKVQGSANLDAKACNYTCGG
jgi:hypothetical protein